MYTKLTDLLNQCHEFEENVESGHSVMTFGHPYHYAGSKNPKEVIDLPEEMLDVMKLIKEKYPQCADLNSCLVNKYSGPAAFLPKHADNEPTIAPGSSIYTVSIGSSAKVKFTNTHNGSAEEKVVHPNSLFLNQSHLTK